jgi:hypothetical protein
MKLNGYVIRTVRDETENGPEVRATIKLMEGTGIVESFVVKAFFDIDGEIENVTVIKGPQTTDGRSWLANDERLFDILIPFGMPGEEFDDGIRQN